MVLVLQASKLLRTRVEELAGIDTGPLDYNYHTARSLSQAQSEEEAEVDAGAEADEDEGSSMDYPDGASGGSDFDHYAWVKSAVSASSKAVYRPPNAKRLSGRESTAPQRASKKTHFAKVRSEGVGRQHPAGSGEDDVPTVSKLGSPSARRTTDAHTSVDGEVEHEEGGQARGPRQSVARGQSDKTPRHRASVSFGRDQDSQAEEEDDLATPRTAGEDMKVRAARRRSRGISARGSSLKAVSSRQDEAMGDEGSAKTLRHRARQSVSVERQQTPQMKEEGLASARTAEHDLEARAVRRHQSLSPKASSGGRSAGLMDLELLSSGGAGSERGLSMRQSRRGQSAMMRRSPTSEAGVHAAPPSGRIRRRGREEDVGVEETSID